MGLTLHLLELGVVGGEEKVDALRLPVTVDVQLEIGQRGAGGGKIHDLENDVPQEEHVDTQMKSTLNVHNAALHREREGHLRGAGFAARLAVAPLATQPRAPRVGGGVVRDLSPRVTAAHLA